MRRRELVAIVAAAAAWPFAARAQQVAGSIPRIAYLGGASASTLDPRQIEQFKAGLIENGLMDGQNIQVDYLWGEGNSERLSKLATELAQRSLDVIVTAGPQPLRALRDAGVKSRSFSRFSLIQSATALSKALLGREAT